LALSNTRIRPRGRGGWIFDFDISTNQAAQQVLADPDAEFQLVHPSLLGIILEETDYYFVSNQQSIYAEQFETGSLFLNQGTLEPASVSVFHRGQELSADRCPPITVWQYRSIPLQDPGYAMPISTNHKPGQPIIVETSQPGNFLFTFSINDESNPAPPTIRPAIRHLHESAIHHECGVNQPSHPAQRRGLQPVLRRPPPPSLSPTIG